MKQSKITASLNIVFYCCFRFYHDFFCKAGLIDRVYTSFGITQLKYLLPLALCVTSVLLSYLFSIFPDIKEIQFFVFDATKHIIANVLNICPPLFSRVFQIRYQLNSIHHLQEQRNTHH